jgi:hypothetical protein
LFRRVAIVRQICNYPFPSKTGIPLGKMKRNSYLPMHGSTAAFEYCNPSQTSALIIMEDVRIVLGVFNLGMGLLDHITKQACKYSASFAKTANCTNSFIGIQCEPKVLHICEHICK